ncbi:hypothetical protein FHS39_002402 [Streptomyces olivoverticillatus]|uniref:Uncharacterized protein n=2 Tax=Streptomyces olivoverticillatus TaxID=66427 RepID=A0A7W7LPG5_9ACTN|nr:hypothetical protein [Streptomyces olivoverticillatus]
MQVLASAEFRPILYHGTIEVGPIWFRQRPENDKHVEGHGDGLRLNSYDPTLYPEVRLEHISGNPHGLPPGNWDYSQIISRVTVKAPVQVLSMFGQSHGALPLPAGLYDMRILLRRDEIAIEEDDEPDEFIDDFDDEELDISPGDPVEHWLIQFWPATQPTD